MTRRGAPATALRDQLVAALHGSYPVPLTTRELADQLAPVAGKLRHPCREVGCARADAWTGEPRILECHSTWHLVLKRRPTAAIHRQLLALSRAGLVIRLGHNRQASQAEPWTVEPDAAAFQQIADLEQMWRSS